MASIQADLDSKKQTMAQLQSRDKIAGDLLNMRRALEETQAGSKERTLRALQESLEARREVTTVASTIQQHQHELESLAAEREVFIKQWQARLSEELVARRDERSGIIEQYSKAKRRLALVRLETPVDAVVLEIAPRSVGSVISSAEPLVKLVPLNAPLEVEANISAQDFGHVRIGDPVELKLDAYSFMEYGVLRGEVMIISEDAFQDRQGMDSVTVYKARIRLVTTTLDTNNQPDSFRLVPGMPLSAEIKVGERSVIKYFLRPVLRGLKEGLREP
jgi:HlyD family type I secretion membrane fusion protein